MKLLLPALFIASLSTSAWAVDAKGLLEKAETIRNPQNDYTVDVILTNNNKGKEETKTFKSMIKGRDKALVHFKKPEIDAGKQVLMVDNSMWIYMPQTAKPIRISPKQKLAGNAAYGDIARLNFIGNYTPTYKGKNKFEGKEALVLTLDAIQDRPVTYTKLEYWIDAKTNRPLKVDYMTQSGKVLKSGFFFDYKNVLGVERPTQMKIVDFLNKKKVTVLKFENAKKKSLPDLLFQKQNLGRS